MLRVKTFFYILDVLVRFALLDSHPQAHPTGSEDWDPEQTVSLVVIVIDHV
jgi:hypothetical protein